MSQKEFDREMTEIIDELSYMEKLLQEEDNQRREWSMKKQVRWPMVQLFVKKLRKSIREMKKEKLRGVELRHKPLTEEKEVHYCEP